MPPPLERPRLLLLWAASFGAVACGVGYWVLWDFARATKTALDSFSDVLVCGGLLSAVTALVVRFSGRGRTQEAVAVLPCGGTLSEKAFRAWSQRGFCTRGCLHARVELERAIGAPLIPAWRQDLTAFLMVAVSAAVLGFLYLRAVRPWGTKIPFFLQPCPNGLGLFGISLGFYRLFGHDFTGVEAVVSVGFTLFGVLAVVEGLLLRQPPRQ